MSFRELIPIYTQSLSDTVHYLDLAMAGGAFIGRDSMSDYQMLMAEEKLRRIADEIASRRRRLLADHPRLPFLQAAE